MATKNKKFVSKGLPKPATATPQGIDVPRPDRPLTRAEEIILEEKQSPKPIDEVEALPTPVEFGSDDDLEDTETDINMETESNENMETVSENNSAQTAQTNDSPELNAVKSDDQPNIGRPIIETVEDDQGESLPKITQAESVVTQRNNDNNLQANEPNIQPEIVDFSRVDSQSQNPAPAISSQSPIDQFIENSNTPAESSQTTPQPIITQSETTPPVIEQINETQAPAVDQAESQPPVQTAMPELTTMPTISNVQSPPTTEIPEEIKELSGQTNQSKTTPNWAQPNFMGQNSTNETKKTGLLKNILMFAGMVLGGTLLVMIGYFTAPKIMNSKKDKTAEPDKQNIAATNPTPAPTPAPTPSPEPKIDLTNLKIKILNGSGKKGEATRAKNSLQDLEFASIDAGNADNFDYQDTEVNYKADYKEVFADLKKALTPNYNVVLGEELKGDDKYDLYIVLGSSKTQADETPTASESANKQ